MAEIKKTGVTLGDLTESRLEPNTCPECGYEDCECPYDPSSEDYQVFDHRISGDRSEV